MPPKLAAFVRAAEELEKRSARGSPSAAPNQVYINEDSPFADPRLVIPGIATAVGAGLGGPDVSDKVSGGLKGLLAGGGMVGGGMLGKHLGGDTGMLLGGAGGAVLPLLLARAVEERRRKRKRTVE
jgi:hypothetical protein